MLIASSGRIKMLDYIELKRKFDIITFSVLFCWLLWYIGYNQELKDVCAAHDSGLYYATKFSFSQVNVPELTSRHYCMHEIPIATCISDSKTGRQLQYHQCVELPVKYLGEINE